MFQRHTFCTPLPAPTLPLAPPASPLLLLLVLLALPRPSSAAYGVGPENSTATFYGGIDASATMGAPAAMGTCMRQVRYCTALNCTVLFYIVL